MRKQTNSSIIEFYRFCRTDKDNPITILDDIDVSLFTKRLMELLEIKNNDKTLVKIDEDHVKEIKEYLDALDLIQEIEIYDIDSKDIRNRVAFTQPGLRYSQAKSFVDSLLMDEVFVSSLSFKERNNVIERVLNEIKGRMMEDIILLETKLANPDKKVFKLQFADGEYDMVLWNHKTGEVELYEIKYSKEVNEQQVKHLINEDKCSKVEFRFGKIIKKTVIYRGEETKLLDVNYLNVENYLSSLYQ